MVKYLTREGLEKLKKELERLTTVDRPEIVKRIKSSAALGDLKENAGYHAAKEDQAFIEGRIQELTEAVTQAEVIEKKASDDVRLGSIVELSSKSGIKKYQIVDPQESDILSGKISFKSPLGAALLGKKKGNTLKLTTPAGIEEYKIIIVE
jgi:transcription elongation factor GreA